MTTITIRTGHNEYLSEKEQMNVLPDFKTDLIKSVNVFFPRIVPTLKADY